MNKKWQVLKKAPKDYLKKFKDYNPVVVQMLYNRNLKNNKEAESFLNPDYNTLFDPYLLKGMDKAVKRIIKAVDREENIVIFGDYDVDGITSTALLYKILSKFGAKVNFYIPNRMKEGYGLNKGAIDYLAKEGANLIITVDNGIGNKNEVAYASAKKIDVIITDHHEIANDKPRAYAIINPKQKGDSYPFDDLAGVGVVFKLASALAEGFSKYKKKEILSSGNLKWYLDLVVLGTIADMVPLLGENRIFAHFGLLVLSKTKNIGVKTLAKVGGIDLENSNPHDIGFKIGPRLNAAGRMAHAVGALELLLTDDLGEAGVLALRLERLNQERQEIVKRNLEKIILEQKESKLENILVLKENDWTAGIIGLIAGRISDYFSRPVFCMAEDKGIIKGSVRSSVDFDVVENLILFKKHFLNFGGHRKAGGFSLESKNFEIFQREIVEHGRKILKEGDLTVSLIIESEIKFSQINKDVLGQIRKFEPFGKENEKPIFLTRNVKISEVKKVGGEGEHLKLKLTSEGISFSAIGFGLGDLEKDLYYGKSVDVAYEIVENSWNESNNVELKIEDLKLRE